MIRSFIALLFLLPNFLSAQSWEEFVTVDAAFRIMVPETMELQEDTIQAAIGSVIRRTYFSSADEGKLVFIVNCFDYPEATVHSDSTDLLEELYDATLDEAIASVEGELKYVDDWVVSDYQGKHWRIDYLEGNATIRAKAIVVNNRFYSIQVASPASVQYSEMTLHFLDSFELLQ